MLDGRASAQPDVGQACPELILHVFSACRSIKRQAFLSQIISLIAAPFHIADVPPNNSKPLDFRLIGRILNSGIE
jgi:hypothetical protein